MLSSPQTCASIPQGVITIRPNGSGQRILVSIAKFVADEIDAALGERVMFTMLT
jgi:hypothetical protein